METFILVIVLYQPAYWIQWIVDYQGEMSKTQCEQIRDEKNKQGNPRQPNEYLACIDVSQLKVHP